MLARKDPFEKQNLAETMPGKTREQFKELSDWLDENVATKRSMELAGWILSMRDLI